MAQEIIKSTDIIESDVFKDVRESAEKTIPIMKDLSSTMLDFLKMSKEKVMKNPLADKSDLEELDALQKSAISVAKSKVKIDKDLIRTQAELAAMYDRETNSISNTVVELQKARSAKSELNKEARQQAKLAEAEIGSLEQLRVKLSQATKELDRMGEATLKSNKGIEQIAKVKEYSDAISKVEQASGRFYRNVGNYESGNRALSASINQLTREVPAFANSFATGFMAISNNLPIFFDEISKVTKEVSSLRDQGKPTESVLQRLGKSFFSVQTAMSLGVTLLTIFGDEILNFIVASFKGTTALDKFTESQEALNKAFKDNSVKEAVVNIDDLKIKIDLAKKGVIDKEEVLNQYNSTIGTTTGLVTDLDSAERELVKNGDNFIRMTLKKAQAQAALSKAADLQLKAEEDKIAGIKNVMGASNKMPVEGFVSNLNALSTNAHELSPSEIEMLTFQKINYDKVMDTYNKKLVDSEMLMGIAKDAYNEVASISKKAVFKNDGSSSSSTNLPPKEKRAKEIQDVSDYYDKLMAARINAIEDGATRELNILANKLDKEKRLNTKNYGSEKAGVLNVLLDAEYWQNVIDIEIKYSEMMKKRSMEIEAEREQRIQDEYNRQKKYTSDYYNEEKLIIINARSDNKITEEQYNKEIQELRVSELQRRINDARDYNQETIDMELELAEIKLNINKASRDNIEKLNNEARNTRIENEKAIYDNIAKVSSDFYVKETDNINRSINQSQRRQDELRLLAAQGVDDAKASLAAEEKIQAEAEEKRQKLADKKRKSELLLQGAKDFTTRMEKGEDPQKALGSAITDMGALVLAVNALPSFFEGTENTGDGGKLDANGGHLAILHKNERIFNAQDNAKIGDISNKDAANVLSLYNKGVVPINISKYNSNENSVISELRSVKKAIESISIDIPEQQLYYDAITKSLISQVETKNKIDRTHYRENKGIWSD